MRSDPLRTAAHYLAMAVHAESQFEYAGDYWTLYFQSLERCSESDQDILSLIEQSAMGWDHHPILEAEYSQN